MTGAPCQPTSGHRQVKRFGSSLRLLPTWRRSEWLRTCQSAISTSTVAKSRIETLPGGRMKTLPLRKPQCVLKQKKRACMLAPGVLQSAAHGTPRHGMWFWSGFKLLMPEPAPPVKKYTRGAFPVCPAAGSVPYTHLPLPTTLRVADEMVAAPIENKISRNVRGHFTHRRDLNARCR